MPNNPQPRICKFAPYRNGAMRAWFSIELASGLVLYDLRLMVGPNGPWIAMPATRQVDRDGNSRRDANGKELWTPIIDFRNRQTRDKFRDMALALLRRNHPEAFD